MWNEVSVPLPHYTCCDFHLVGSSVVISQVTISPAMGSFLLGGQLQPCVYLARLQWCRTSNILGSRLDL